MKKRILLLPTILVFIPYFVISQKLPTKQISSLWPPNPVKIDGSADEWNKQYQAYNKNTDFFYSLANDESNIYLVIHSTLSRSIEKIVEGGVSLTVTGSAKKDDKSKVVVLFPLLPLPIAKGILVAAGKRITGTTMDNNGHDITQSLDAASRDKQGKSIAKANNQLIKNLKEIKVSGIPEVVDTIINVRDTTKYYRTLPLRGHSFKIIPIANNDNIKAMMQFDENGELTLEISIPLQYLGKSIAETHKFFYNITVNGRGEDSRPGNTWVYATPPAKGILDQDLEEPTDFSGEYTLAKAQ